MGFQTFNIVTVDLSITLEEDLFFLELIIVKIFLFFELCLHILLAFF